MEKKIRLLFLDDIRQPKDCIKYLPEKIIYSNSHWEVVKTYEEFVSWIKENGLPTMISFDHDLGDDKTGYDCAVWLIEYCINRDLKLPNCLIHSMNIVGKKNIVDALFYGQKYIK